MIFKTIKIVILTLFIVLSTSTSWAIFGGINTNPDMRDSLVSIVMSNGTCSGVLIAKNIALTAAHCVDMMGQLEKAVLLSKDPSTKHCNTAKVVDFSYTPGAKAILPKSVHAPDLVIVKLESKLCSAKVASISDTQPAIGSTLIRI